ncbi:MAG: hypothetical protein IT443_02580 [Phycisphaeraceae bacterium]|nr:hypothetical protein [Phycisphaeraceae bacterium]
MNKLPGPLRVHPTNPRYFADASGRALLLTGSHTWDNLQDVGWTNPPPEFDYEQFLDFLTRHGHNFFRLWTWEHGSCPMKAYQKQLYFVPTPFVRSGPGVALDGLPRYDLEKFDPIYFQRMRQRVMAAGERGFYVSIMLFDGWSIEEKNAEYGSPWAGHFFHRDNNSNGVDGDPDKVGDGRATHHLRNPAVTRVQERYVRQVIETVGDLPNVLYEISNESNGEAYAWHNHLIDFIHEVESHRPMRHPVGFTVPYPGGDNEKLLASGAEWISPKPGQDQNDPEIADGRKVILDDTDHLWGIGGDRYWAWKSFCRGRNPLFMDPYTSKSIWVDELKNWNPDDDRWHSLRRNLGYIRHLAEKVDLAALTPRGELSSTGYCLATADDAARPTLIAYQPTAGEFSVDLSRVRTGLKLQWLNPADGSTSEGGPIGGKGKVTLKPPYAHDAVGYLHT